MISETTENPSVNTEDGFEWVSVREAAIRLGDTEKTIYNRTKPGHSKFLKSREKEKKTEVLIPLITEPSSNPVSKPLQNVSHPFSEQLQKRNEELQKQVQTLQNELTEARMEAARFASYEERIQDRDTQIADLKQQLDNLPTRLEKFYEGRLIDKEEIITQLRAQTASQQQQIDELLRDKQYINNQLNSSHGTIQKYKSIEETLQEIRESIRKPAKKGLFGWLAGR